MLILDAECGFGCKSMLSQESGDAVWVSSSSRLPSTLRLV